MAVVTYGERSGERDWHGGAVVDRSAAHAIGTRPDIPVWRHGTVPPPPEDSGWQIESGEAEAPRTIGEYGGVAVFAAALATALITGWLLYLR